MINVINMKITKISLNKSLNLLQRINKDFIVSGIYDKAFFHLIEIMVNVVESHEKVFVVNIIVNFHWESIIKS